MAEPCGEIKCAERLVPDNGEDIIDCERTHEEMRGSCFLPRPMEEKFYNYLPEEKASKNSLGTMFNEFAIKITDSDEIKEIYFRLFADEATRPRIKFEFLKNSNHEHCDDIIAKFYIQKMTGASPRKGMFHIALHPRFPVYKREERRALSGCGFYEKKEGDTHDGSGSFHYKIENLKWGTGKSKPELRSDKKQQPYKKFHINQIYPYKFNKDHSDFENEKEDEIKGIYVPALTDEEYRLGMNLHKVLYDLFIIHWNHYVTGGKSTGNTPSNSLKQTAIKLLTSGVLTKRTHQGGTIKKRVIRPKVKTHKRK